VREGVTATDADVAAILQKSGKRVVLACNKCDTPGDPPLQLYDFYNLGIGEPVPVSAIHGLGTGDLLDVVTSDFQDAEIEEDDDILKIAIVGRPNVGKSSLINKIFGENRVIVSPIAGTTRDSIDTPYTKDGNKYLLIDTAGMRKKSRIEENIERYSVIRALNAIERANIALIMIDATEGIAEQDSKIAGYAHDNGKASIIAVNKWDAVEKDSKTQNKYRDQIQHTLPFMQYAPIVFISAKTGQRVDRLFDLFQYVSNQNSMRISTGALNDCINEATAKAQPPSDKGKRLKIFYATQVSVRPPTFVLFVNDSKLMHFSYLRYIENQIRDVFGFEGTPIRFKVRDKEDE
jgi:GTP-binding protein